MTREETISKVCAILGLAYHAIGDYSHASDCFCHDHRSFQIGGYHNEGKIVDYVEQAVRKKLARDGFTVKV